MAISMVFKTVVAGAVAIFAATSLVACSSGSSSSVSLDSTAVRKASGYLPSRICVNNFSNQTIMFVGEFEMTRTGESHSDSSGPLASGGEWCTEGYNAFSDPTGMEADAIVEIKFSDTKGDFVRIAARNGYLWDPYITYGQEVLNNAFVPMNANIYERRFFSLPSGRIEIDSPWEYDGCMQWDVYID